MEQSVRMTLPLPRNVANRPGKNACNLGFAKRDSLLGTHKKVGAVALVQGQKPKHQTVGLPFKRAEIRAILYTGNTMDDDKLMSRSRRSTDAIRGSRSR